MSVTGSGQRGSGNSRNGQASPSAEDGNFIDQFGFAYGQPATQAGHPVGALGRLLAAEGRDRRRVLALRDRVRIRRGVEPLMEMDMMKSTYSSSSHRMSAVVSPLRVSFAAFACLGLLSGIVAAQSGQAAKKAAGANGTATKQYEDFDPGKFNRSTHIDNEWLPLKPGTRFVYDGTTVEDDGKTVPHRIVVNVTDLTKMIGGVRALDTKGSYFIWSGHEANIHSR
jgi:hypothetical protein